MFVFKNRYDPKLSEANFHARLCRLKQLLENVRPMILASFLSTDEKTFTCTVTTPKNPQNDRLYSYQSTKKKDVVTKRLHTQLTFSH